MDLYVYVDDSLIVGDDAVIHMAISESDSLVFDRDEELTKYFEMHKRLNILVTSGYENNRFSSKMKDLNAIIIYSVMEMVMYFWDVRV